MITRVLLESKMGEKNSISAVHKRGFCNGFSVTSLGVFGSSPLVAGKILFIELCKNLRLVNIRFFFEMAHWKLSGAAISG